ncbi:MAG: phosphatase PAP2 family protein [Halanaeroarchaeum sp.]
MRGIGVAAAIANAVPEPFVAVLLVATGLGDPVFVALLSVIVYWLGPRYGLLSRRAGATVLAITIFALSSSVFLKYGFSLPRPPADVLLVPEDGKGFPSGHVTGAMATYGALAYYLERGSQRSRYALGMVLVTVVAFTRIALGVHYLVDVLAGVAVGLGAILAVRWVSLDSMNWAFAMAVPVGLAGVILAGTMDSVLLAGVAIGTTGAWRLVSIADVQRPPTPTEAAAGLVAGGVLLGLGYWSGVLVVGGLVGAGAGALFVSLPAFPE